MANTNPQNSFLGYYKPFTITSSTTPPTLSGKFNTVLLTSTSTTSSEFNGINNSSTVTDIPVALIKNVWGIKSPNSNDQLLIMTDDSKYISMFSYIIMITMYLFESEKMIEGSISSIAMTNSIYYSLYFMLQYGQAPSGIKFVNIMQLLSPRFTVLTNNKYQPDTPAPTILDLIDSPPGSEQAKAYETLSKLKSSILTPKYFAFLYSTVCLEIGNNGPNALSYKNMLDPTNKTNFIKSDWIYASNYFNTIYILLNQNQPSNFCVDILNPTNAPTNTPTDTPTGTPFTSNDSTVTECKNNTTLGSLITISGKSYGNSPIFVPTPPVIIVKSSPTPTATPATTPAKTSNYWSMSTGILAIILFITLLIIGFVLFRMITPKKIKSNSNSHNNDEFSTDNPMSKGGYFYFD